MRARVGMDAPGVRFALTPEQREYLEPLFALIEQAYIAGRPCAIMGQPSSDGIEVFFGVLTHEQTLAVIEIVAPNNVHPMKKGNMV